MAPQHRSFTVAGNGSFPPVKILRTKTVFNGNPGPVGYGVKAGSPVNWSVYYISESPLPLEGLKFELTVCEWDDTLCESKEFFFFKEDIPC